MNNELDIINILQEARNMKNFIPNSFIAADFTFDPKAQGLNPEVLAK